MQTIFFDVQSYEEDFLKSHFPKSLLFKKSLNDFAALNDEIKNADIISVFTKSSLNKAVLEKFKNLKLIATRSVGFSHIDIDYCKEHGIKIANTPHYGDYTVAEFAFGLLLAVARKIDAANQALREGQIDLRDFIGVELFEKTVGVIGTGSIGKAFIKIAKGFSMNVLGYDLYPDPSLGIEYVSFEELLKRSDVISLHTPLSKDNFHLLNAEAFKKMKNNVIIINTARGELIDTMALYNALNDKKVLACGLDVIECEEIVANEDDYINVIDTIDENCLKKFLLNQKLIKLPNVLITPHVAYDSQDAINRILNMTYKNIEGFLNNENTNFVI